MPGYQYVSLQPGRRDIRLLELQPGPEDSLIHCVLKKVSLDDNPAYEALSYAWGETNLTHSIIVDGQNFLLTRNLAIALNHLRYDLQVRTLWIDAIRINQPNIEERNHQVRQMRMIYEKATRVIAWLGEECDNSDLVMDLLATVKEADLELLETLGEAPDAWKAIPAWGKRAWWNRVWIVQEIAVSPHDPLVGCGKKWMYWSDLVKGAQTIHGTVKVPNVGVLEYRGHMQLALRLDLIREWTQKKMSKNIFELLCVANRRFKATEPLDQIIGLIGLATGNDQTVLVPDYRKSVREFYREVAAYIVHLTKRLTILNMVREYPEGYQRHKLPSWCPDWSMPKSHTWTLFITTESENSASFSIPATVCTSVTPDRLHVRGILVDRIGVAAEGSFTVDMGMDRLRDLLQSWETTAQQALANCLPDVGLKSLYEVDWFWRTLVRNRSESYITPAPDDYGNRLRVFLNQEPVPPEFEPTREPNMRKYSCIFPMYYSLVATILGRLFFVTCKGYLGLGPLGLQPGDLICVLFGGETPYILRKDGSHHTFLGEAYVHNIMSGEALAMGLEEQEFILT